MIVVRRLIWYPVNVAHIARHEVVPEEVEAVCHGDPLVQVGKSGRFLVIGLTQDGRMLTVVLDPEPVPGLYYPVTARPASLRERRIYTQERGGERK
jgi:uncharacterized DUF497 family protein